MTVLYDVTLLVFVAQAHEVALYQYERPNPIIKRDISLLVAKTGEMTFDHQANIIVF